MSNNTQRSFLWLLGMVALVGNLFVFIWRTVRDENLVSGYLVKYLALADFLMGVYMIGIASVDSYYRGVYIENSTAWKNSWLCKLFGVISTISSETSVFTLGVITVDRLINITAPFSSWRLNLKKARLMIVLIWVLAAIIAVIPLFPSVFFEDQFYSRSGVCVSLHITNEETPGWKYSVAIFHGLNFSIYIFVFVSYGFIYRVIRDSTKIVNSEQRKSEMAAARKITLIVLTDFCCWVPINIMGVLAMTGTSIPGEMYAWTIVFILPVNSALNPILYTISSSQLPCKKTPSQVSKKDIRTSGNVEITLVQDDGRLSLGKVLSDQALAQPRVLLKLSMEVTKIVQSLHEVPLTLTKLDVDSIVIKNWSTDNPVAFEMAFIGHPELPSLGEAGNGKSDDMATLGKIISRLLRAHTYVQKQGDKMSSVIGL